MSIPTKAQWFGQLQTTVGVVTAKLYDMFGWKIHQHTLPAGGSLTLFSKDDVEPSDKPNRTMYVRGLATLHANGVRGDDRVPGMWSMDRPKYIKGITKVTALVETEYWCVNYTVNRNNLPELTPVRLADGESQTFPAGTLLFALYGTAGDVVGPSQVEVETELTLTAVGPFYAFVVGARA